MKFISKIGLKKNRTKTTKNVTNIISKSTNDIPIRDLSFQFPTDDDNDASIKPNLIEKNLITPNKMQESFNDTSSCGTEKTLKEYLEDDYCEYDMGQIEEEDKPFMIFDNDTGKIFDTRYEKHVITVSNTDGNATQNFSISSA